MHDSRLEAITYSETASRLRYGMMWLEMQERTKWWNPLIWPDFAVVVAEIWDRRGWN